MKFHRYQALGNDYLVVEAPAPPSPALISRVCDRHFGVGADGLLLESPCEDPSAFGLRIYNPDGSEAEKSGNGLRIFARYLWDRCRVSEGPFQVMTAGGAVTCEVRENGSMVFVEMGTACFESVRIPVSGSPREVVNEDLTVGEQTLRFTAVSVGNPHCVVHSDDPSADLARRLGPLIETHPLFPNRTNVQFVRVVDPHNIRMGIWERGAGYTLASGTSSCAAAAASVRLGFCRSPVQVSMPGGRIDVGVTSTFAVTLLGPVGRIADGIIDRECLDDLR